MNDIFCEENLEIRFDKLWFMDFSKITKEELENFSKEKNFKSISKLSYESNVKVNLKEEIPKISSFQSISSKIHQEIGQEDYLIRLSFNFMGEFIDGYLMIENYKTKKINFEIFLGRNSWEFTNNERKIKLLNNYLKIIIEKLFNKIIILK